MMRRPKHSLIFSAFRKKIKPALEKGINESQIFVLSPCYSALLLAWPGHLISGKHLLHPIAL